MSITGVNIDVNIEVKYSKQRASAAYARSQRERAPFVDSAARSRDSLQLIGNKEAREGRISSLCSLGRR